MIPGFGAKQPPARGLPLPGDLRLPDARRRRSSSSRAQLQAFAENWAQVNLSYARSKNLTPYDVLIIASIVEKEALVPDERPKIARGDLQPPARDSMHARHRRDAPLRPARPGDEVAHRVRARTARTRTTRATRLLGLPPTPIANPGLASIQAAAHPATSTTSTSSASRTTGITTSPRTTTTSSRTSSSTGQRASALDDATSRCSATRWRTRSRRGCRTPRSQRAGLDWALRRARRAADAVRRRVARARRARLRRRERHHPAQAGRRRRSATRPTARP